MVPSSLRDLPQWLIWRSEPHPEQGKKNRKMPYYIGGAKRQGPQGSDEDRAQLVRFDAAVAAMSLGKYDGVGFAFLPDDGLAGIDLDKVIDPETGEISDRALKIVEALDSYTEISPSKTGLHVFVSTDQVGRFASFKSNKIGVEVFCSAQFFTFTGDRYAGTPEVVNPISAENLQRLRATVRAKNRPAAGASASAPPAVDDEQRRAEAALIYVNADDYQEWIDIGMALKHAFSDGGYGIWDRWSARSAKYPGGEETRRRWQTFQPTGAITLGTVFELAKRGGWSPPRRSSPRTTKKDQKQGGDPPPPSDDQGGGEPGDPGEGLPIIQWKAGKLPEVVDQAEAALIAAKLRIYQRAGYLVRVVQRAQPSVRNYKRPAGALGIITVDAPFLIESFTRAARWEKWNARSEKWQRCNAPEQSAATYIARVGHWRLPQLWSAISAPTLRPDGTVLQEPGYDADMQSWYDPCGIKFPNIAEAPTKDDAIEALKKLRAWLCTFPFVGGVDESVAFSLALTALVRRSLPAAPLGAITAPVMSSGKTLLADGVAILATGISAPAMKYAETDEETTKTMLAVLAEGDQVVLIDNVERPLSGDTLCAVLTSETYRQRVLGRTEMMSVPTTTLFMATGNHLVIAGDLRTRTLLCRLDPKVEHPEQRQFEAEFREWTTSRRPELVAAGLTIMRAFIATGQSVQDHCKTWGRFERWSDMVRAPLIWLDCADPCESLADLEREDPERLELARMMDAWQEVFNDVAHTAREAVQAATTSITAQELHFDLVLRDVCKDRDGTLNSKRLGHWLRAHAGRLVGGKKIVKGGEKDHTVLWKVEAMNTG